MDPVDINDKNLLGWIGTACLLLILPIKLLRFLDEVDMPLIIGVAPSILGPAGLLFLLLSSTGRLSRLTPLQAALMAGVVAILLEVVQLLPRPGILARVRYTFDYLDLVASLLSLVAAYIVIWGITRRSEPRRVDGE
jgi:hypothetical protein